MKEYQQEKLELLSFLEGYAGFFEQYAQREEEKLAALKSNKLNRIEKTLAAEQAAVMEMGNLEKRRAALQEAAGLGDRSFRQVIEAMPPEGRERCRIAMERMETAIAAIKEGNRQCETVAKEKMAVIAKVVPETEAPPKAYSPYQKKGTGASPTIFESKI